MFSGNNWIHLFKGLWKSAVFWKANVNVNEESLQKMCLLVHIRKTMEIHPTTSARLSTRIAMDIKSVSN